MIIVLGSVTVPTTHLSEAMAQSQAHVARSRSEPGCISHAVYEDPDSPGRLVFVEQWADQAALAEHFKVPASGEFVTAISAFATEAPAISLFQAEPLPAGEDSSQAESVVREFWRLMASNDFHAVQQVLAPDFVAEWPQSKERIRGGENFARVNAEYPSKGRWRFTLNRIVASAADVVTQVSVTDGELNAEPVSFFTVANGRITRLVEFWPEPYEPAGNRRHLVETMP